MGSLYCALSAVGFGLIAVFARSAHAAGASVEEMLLVRFGIAAVVLLAVSAAMGSLHRLSRTAVLAGLAMGAFGYAVQASLYFSALEHLDAALVALVFYVYPILVVVAAVVIGREQRSLRRVAALGVALTGIALVLAGAAGGRPDAWGVLLACGSAVTYAGYILLGDRVGADAPPVAMAAVVCAGTTASFLVVGGLRGAALVDVEHGAWPALLAMALLCTVGAVLLFLAGLARVGPSTAAILSILEPVVTVLSAAAVLGERLGPVQWIGGALVLAALIWAQGPRRPKPASRAPEPVPAEQAAREDRVACRAGAT